MEEKASSGSFVQFAVFSVDPAWHQLSGKERDAGISDFAVRLNSMRVHSHVYLLTGLKASADLLLWRISDSLEMLQQNYLSLRKSGFGMHLADIALYNGVTRPSTYTRTESEFDFLTSEKQRKRFISIYPFTKTNEWYLIDYEKRRKIMSDHITIGRRFPEVTQTLLYSFGADDQEFVVAYEMDDMRRYIECVMALRESESRLYTKADTPIYTGTRKSVDDIAALFGGSNE